MPFIVKVFPDKSDMNPSILTRSFSAGIGSNTGSTTLAAILVDPGLKVAASTITFTVIPSVIFAVVVAPEASETVSGVPSGTGVTVKFMTGLPVTPETMPLTWYSVAVDLVSSRVARSAPLPSAIPLTSATVPVCKVTVLLVAELSIF